MPSSSVDAETKSRLLATVMMPNHQMKIEQMGLVFTLPSYDHIELVKDGNNTNLCLENAQDYIDLVLHSTFYDCINLQMQAFKKGFNSVMPLDSVRSFQIEEIETMVCGEVCNEEDWKDISKLQSEIQPDHGFTRQSRCYNDFLKFIVNMEPELRPKFIQWMTGCKRLPRGGFGSLANGVSVNRVAEHSLNGISPDDKCPSVNTCLHYLKFPEYSSYEVLKHKFE